MNKQKEQSTQFAPRCSLVIHGVQCEQPAEYRLLMNEGDRLDLCEHCLGWIVGFALADKDMREIEP